MAAEFEADAKAKVEELAALLAEREREFYAYKQSATDAAQEDYEDEEEGTTEGAAKPKSNVDEIDYADDEEEDEDVKDEM